jgi:preprotein translocase subunit YajC
MCYTSVAGGGKSIIHALQGGIIVLLIPPVLLFSGLTFLLFRWRTSASSRTRLLARRLELGDSGG